MVTFSELQTKLEKGSFTHEQSQVLVEVLELTQRKLSVEIETDLRRYLEGKFEAIDDRFEELEDRFDRKFDALDERFVTKDEFHAFRTEMFKWMFIFWSAQLIAMAGMLFGVVKLLRP